MPKKKKRDRKAKSKDRIIRQDHLTEITLSNEDLVRLIAHGFGDDENDEWDASFDYDEDEWDDDDAYDDSEDDEDDEFHVPNWSSWSDEDWKAHLATLEPGDNFVPDRVSVFDDSERAMSKNKSGSIDGAAKMMRVLRYGHVRDRSEFLSGLFTAAGVDLKVKSHHMLTFASSNGYVSPSIHRHDPISTVVEVNGDGTFSIEIAFVVDELCRLLRAGYSGGLTLRTFLDEPVRLLDGSLQRVGLYRIPIPRKELRSWFMNKGMLEGVSAADQFSAQNTDAHSGNALSPESGVESCSSENVTWA